MQTSYKNCQSCGMPLKQDPGQGGTNSDNSKSTMYCSYCYVNGSFINPDWTAEQMQVFCKQKLKEKGFPSIVAWFLTLGVPKLKRWQKA